MSQPGEDILSMSDEDIMAMAEPSAVAQPVVEEPAPQEPVVPQVEEPAPVEEPAVVPEVPVEEPNPLAQEDDALGDLPPGATPPDKKAAAPVADKPVVPAAEPAKEEPAAVNYEENYKKIMAPFKANGREVKLDNPDDVIKLMQMGANYTKKMQALQPNLRLLKMLENQGLLEESKLNNLIDIHRKNPAAIQQLIKDSGLDPLEIDTSKDSGYVPGNHAVSDQELQFNTILNDVSSTQEGADIVVAIDKQWDDASKQAIYKEPELLNHLLAQKQSGLFDQISEEIGRQRMLGNLVNVPFIHAYHQVGQHLAAQRQAAPVVPVAPTVLETRVAAPVKPVVNSDKARAASPTKAAPQSIKQVINPLEMSDEDFLKMANINL